MTILGMNMAGKLFLCATPIGNLEDITLRVLKCLETVDIIAVEDTRHTQKLLNHYDIKAKLTSYHEHNKYEKADELVEELLNGMNIAVVTDAGTPGISDPGEVLVQKAREAGVDITSLPGASAVITALSMSGLSSRRFVFEGFLPMDKKERKDALQRIEKETRTIVIYEAPHRILKTLKELRTILGDREIRIARELTKIHEEVLCLTIDEAIGKYESEEARGEMVVLIKGLDEGALKSEEQKAWGQKSIEEHLAEYTDKGIPEKEAMKLVAKDRGVSRREIYNQVKR